VEFTAGLLTFFRDRLSSSKESKANRAINYSPLLSKDSSAKNGINIIDGMVKSVSNTKSLTIHVDTAEYGFQ